MSLLSVCILTMILTTIGVVAAHLTSPEPVIIGMLAAIAAQQAGGR